MKKDTMGTGAAMGVQHTDSRRVFPWLWHSWLEAQRELPLLRWLSLAALAAAALAVVLAARQGGGILDMLVDGAMAILFILAIPVIFYLLFEIYRKHRTDAIFDSKRLADLIRKISLQEIQAHQSGLRSMEASDDSQSGQGR
ncbi:MAG TPA: hypothetical protein VNZ54_02215 [bacterium]|jgi:hypothetical protein|nr:hypothetical protein [bacterium]